MTSRTLSRLLWPIPHRTTKSTIVIILSIVVILVGLEVFGAGQHGFTLEGWWKIVNGRNAVRCVISIQDPKRHHSPCLLLAAS